jgi:hypothetical protein
MIVTLDEKTTLDAGYYLFRFVHAVTKAVVSKIYNFDDDGSDYPTRFNSFAITPSVTFLNQQTGRWNYFIYEQASSTNTDPDGLTEVERGIMRLNPANDFSFDDYNGSTTFKAYNG